jgi:hypothetical protein
VVGHRRTLLLGLGGGAMVVALFGLELAFAVKGPGENRNDGDDEPEGVPSDDASPEMSTELLDKLERLGRLRTSGVLTDDEFEAHKAKLLA